MSVPDFGRDLDLLLATQHVVSQRQEELWGDAKIDGRAVFSVRESYKLYKKRLVEVQDDIERVRWLVKGALQQPTPASKNVNLLSLYFGGCPDVLSHAAENLGVLYDIVGFFLSWPVYMRKSGTEEELREDLGEVESKSGVECLEHNEEKILEKVASPLRVRGKSEKEENHSENNQNQNVASENLETKTETTEETEKNLNPSVLREPLPPTHFAPPNYQTRLRLLIRKRPLLEAEYQENEWDVAKVPEKGQLVLHEGRVAHSGRRLRMHVCHFVADDVITGRTLDAGRVFGGSSNNEMGGGLGKSMPSSITVLCYGQTGTGKTYTMRELVPEAVKRLLTTKCAGGVDESETLSFQAFEVVHKGSSVCDLLNDRKTARIFEDSNRKAVVRATVKEFGYGKNGEESSVDVVSDVTDITNQILKHFDSALSLRRCEATERNSESSRSHAFFILKNSSREIRIVDLAGSERNFETERMNAKQHRESADINSSLMVLKSCMRTLSGHSGSSQQRVPFRESRLTHLLQDCFLPGSDSELVLVATISPCARDAIHSRNTLNHAVEMRWSGTGVKAKTIGSKISTNNSGIKDRVDFKSRFTNNSKIPAIPPNTTTPTCNTPSSNPVSRSCILDLPLTIFYCSDKHISDWSEEDVQNWLGHVAGGRFSKLVLPEGKRDGAGLLSLDSENFATLFENGLLRQARVNEEGASWNIVGPDKSARIGKLFYGLVQEVLVAGVRRGKGGSGGNGGNGEGASSSSGVSGSSEAESGDDCGNGEGGGSCSSGSGGNNEIDLDQLD